MDRQDRLGQARGRLTDAAVAHDRRRALGDTGLHEVDGDVLGQLLPVGDRELADATGGHAEEHGRRLQRAAHGTGHRREVGAVLQARLLLQDGVDHVGDALVEGQPAVGRGVDRAEVVLHVAHGAPLDGAPAGEGGLQGREVGAGLGLEGRLEDAAVAGHWRYSFPEVGLVAVTIEHGRTTAWSGITEMDVRFVVVHAATASARIGMRILWIVLRRCEIAGTETPRSRAMSDISRSWT